MDHFFAVGTEEMYNLISVDVYSLKIFRKSQGS